MDMIQQQFNKACANNDIETIKNMVIIKKIDFYDGYCHAIRNDHLQTCLYLTDYVLLYSKDYYLFKTMASYGKINLLEYLLPLVMPEEMEYVMKLLFKTGVSNHCISVLNFIHEKGFNWENDDLLNLCVSGYDNLEVMTNPENMISTFHWLLDHNVKITNLLNLINKIKDTLSYTLIRSAISKQENEELLPEYKKYINLITAPLAINNHNKALISAVIEEGTPISLLFDYCDMKNPNINRIESYIYLLEKNNTDTPLTSGEYVKCLKTIIMANQTECLNDFISKHKDIFIIDNENAKLLISKSVQNGTTEINKIMNGYLSYTKYYPLPTFSYYSYISGLFRSPEQSIFYGISLNKNYVEVMIFLQSLKYVFKKSDLESTNDEFKKYCEETYLKN